ncbi:MAG TPA: hypothetical protein VEC99_18980 [Clostridia bacterium]|nr:hypothetical protein [Clostridia bacterium]
MKRKGRHHYEKQIAPPPSSRTYYFLVFSLLLMQAWLSAYPISVPIQAGPAVPLSEVTESFSLKERISSKALGILVADSVTDTRAPETDLPQFANYFSRHTTVQIKQEIFLRSEKAPQEMWLQGQFPRSPGFPARQALGYAAILASIVLGSFLLQRSSSGRKM